MGGAEKLMFEITQFARQNEIEPTLLILDNYNKEYYDPIFEANNITVIRTRIDSFKHFRAPAKMFTSIYWAVKLKYFADKNYDSIHVMGLYNVYRILHRIEHKRRFFWHVTNNAQYTNREYNFYGNIFDCPEDTIVCINKYQVNELHTEYSNVIKCKISLFKLFVA
jgi:hypothetical protein